MESYTVVMNARGMITIPKQIRNRRKFNAGMKFYIIDFGEHLILIPKLTEEEFNSNKIDHKELIQSLIEDAERELELEKI